LRLSEGPLAEGLELFALFGLAVAAPLLEVVGRHPGFLVAHGPVGARLAALVAGLLRPTLAMALELGAVDLRCVGVAFAPPERGALR
jgi:hypothetical protein